MTSTLLWHDTALIGCNINSHPKIDNKWFKVSRQVKRGRGYLEVCGTFATKRGRKLPVLSTDR